MYELICPSCKHVQTSSFVRIGAAVTCPSCKCQFRIENKHIRRIVSNNDQDEQNLAMPQTLAQENAPVTGTPGAPQQTTAEKAPPRPALQPPSDPQPKPLHKSVIAATAIIIVVLIAIVIVLGIQRHRRKVTPQTTMANPLMGSNKMP